MPRRKKRFQRKSNPGAPPGTVISQHRRETKICVFGYSAERIEEFEFENFSDVVKLTDQFDVIWVDVVGLGNVDLVLEFGRLFNIHSLSLEDVVNVHQRAKTETHDDYHYIVTRMVSTDNSSSSEQLSIFQSQNFVITFQEKVGDCLEPLRNRIRKNNGIVRKKKADYLVYAILDSVFDHYFPVVDSLGERLDQQDAALMNNEALSLQDIHIVRSQLLDLRRWLRPNRELLNQLIRDESSQISAETKIFLRDCYDHVIHLQESIESYREVCSDLRDFHLSSISNRTNEVMKTLTIVSTIFIPLGFIAGLYGMNFDVMPELKWKYGYFVVLGLMASILAGFLVWFRKRNWI